MNICDFITNSEYNCLCEKAKDRVCFCHERTIKNSKGRFRLRIEGKFTSYVDIWGEAYMIHYSSDRHAPNDIGGDGHGMKVDEFLTGYNIIKNAVKWSFGDYLDTAPQYCQLSLV